MRSSVVSSVAAFVRLIVLCGIVSGFSCRRASAPAPATPLLSGDVEIAGLAAAVRVVRDRWGVPHIHAENRDDLFFAQGFVQAQDRLFQMDLWRRSVQGRLAEVLGVNFGQRDAMTRRMQYRGDVDREWESYGPEARAIASAFVAGVNAWVTRVREAPTEEFALAGWLPEPWSPEDLLNRTDAFLVSVDASDEVLRSRLAAAEHDDLPAVGYAVGDAVRLVGTPPFFMQSGSTGRHPFPSITRSVRFQPTEAAEASDAWVVSGRRSATGAPLLAATARAPLDNPSRRYLVQLSAPGWNAIGATAPWLPGVALGHNEHVAWAFAVASADTQDLYVERVNPANHRQVEVNGSWQDMAVTRDRLRVKGRSRSMFAERISTRHGPVIASDADRNLVFALRWSGAEPGTAAELASPLLDRAGNAQEFRDALDHWKMPSAIFVFADVDGSVGSQEAAVVPERDGWSGALPVPGWNEKREWGSFRPSNALRRESNPSAGYVTTARAVGGSVERDLAPRAVSTSVLTIDDARRMQHGVVAANAEKLIPLLAHVRADAKDSEAIREELRAWDRRVTVDSRPAMLYALWESWLLKKLFEGRFGSHLADDYLSTAGNATELGVAALMNPATAWFGKNPVAGRDRLLLEALVSVTGSLKDRLNDLSEPGGNSDRHDGLTWGQVHTATFSHPLATTTATRRRFSVGPFAVPGSGETVWASDGNDFRADWGPALQMIVDVGDWDRSIVTMAPGQSGSPSSSHFRDLAELWAKGEYFPLVFSDRAVQANAEATLTLIPSPRPISRDGSDSSRGRAVKRYTRRAW